MAEEHKNEEPKVEPLAVSAVSFSWPCWAAGEVEAGVGRKKKIIIIKKIERKQV
jgi:hypothetical protein